MPLLLKCSRGTPGVRNSTGLLACSGRVSQLSAFSFVCSVCGGVCTSAFLASCACVVGRQPQCAARILRASLDQHTTIERHEMQSILTIVMSAIGTAVFFTLLCGVIAVWLAGKDPHRREQLFNTTLELFRLGTTRLLGSIRGHGPRHRNADETPPLRPEATGPPRRNLALRQSD